MDLNEISVFLEVVKQGSFSKAALGLKMPNSTVSAKVSSLERRLGMTLIQRTTRRLNITPAGQAYFKRCLLGLTEIEAAESELAAIQGEPQGLLRITAPADVGADVLPELIADFSAKHPKVRVEAILTYRRMDLLAENVDLAIRAGELKDSTLIAKKLGETYLVPIASPKYLKSRGKPSHPRDLVSHQCLQFTPLGYDEWKMVGPKGSLNVPLPGRIVINDLKVVKRLALMGHGIAYLPTHLCVDEVNSGKLVRLLPEWRSTLNPVHFVYPAQRFVTPKLSEFMAMSMERLKREFKNFEI